MTSSSIDTKAYSEAKALAAASANPQRCHVGGGNIQDVTAGEPVQQGESCCKSDCCGNSSATAGASLSRPDGQGELSKRSNCRLYNAPDGTNLARDFGILYIGNESLAMNNLLLSNSGTPILSYLPDQEIARLESGRTNKMLMRRYGVVSKARDADVYGIVVGTLGVCESQNRSHLPQLTARL